MADVNWTKYHCDKCLALGLALAGLASAAVIWLLTQVGLPVWLLALLFMVVWAALFVVVDRFCDGRTRQQAFEQDMAAMPASPDQAPEFTPNEQPVSDEDASPTPDAEALEAEARAEAARAEAEAAQAAAKADEAAREAAERARREQEEAAEEEARQRAEAERMAAEQAAREEAERRTAEAEQERRMAELAEAAKQTETEAESRATEMAEAPAAFTGTPEPVGDPALGPDRDGDGVREGTDEGQRPTGLDGPRDGVADDLRRIKGVGPKLEQLCNSLGFYHFDQIANWTSDEVAWVDSNLGGFNGRVSRDNWIDQARVLAGGGETEFSKRVDDGDVPSSQ